MKKYAFLIMTAVFLSGCTTNKPWQLEPGQHPQSFEKKVTTEVHGNFLLYLPADYGKENKKWPLIFFLHGSGERGHNLELVKKHGPPKIVENKPDFPFVVVSPQSPEGSGWSPSELNALLDEVIAHLSIDVSRIYLTGLSMGGYGTWAFAIEYPDRFAAIAPICGGGDSDRVCRLKNIPVWVFHGAKDDVVPIDRAKEMVDALKDCGGNVKFTIYPDAGHDAWTKTYSDPELYKWFLEQKRK